MAKKRRRRRKHEEIAISEKKTNWKDIGKLVAIIGATAAIFAFYRFMTTNRLFPVVFAIYLVSATALVLGYVIYNRGFSRKGLTEEMLPVTWSAEEKKEFIEDGERRLRKSRYLLIPIFGLAFTFTVDILELIALPLIQGMLQK